MKTVPGHRLEKETSFCMNCGFIVRPEVSKGDEHINKEHCTACKPFADKCDEEMLLTIRAERKCELRKMTESN